MSQKQQKQQHQQQEQDNEILIVANFRGSKIEIPIPTTANSSSKSSVGYIKSRIINSVRISDNDDLDKNNDSNNDIKDVQNTIHQNTNSSPASSQLLRSEHIKLLYKGKVLKDDTIDIRTILLPSSTSTKSSKVNKTKKTIYRLIAMGISPKEVQTMEEKFQEGVKIASKLVRDDLTEDGQRKLKQRKKLGHQTLMKQQKHNSNNSSSISSNKNNFGFGTIQTLPNLPNEEQAKDILTTLANDPGIIACMKKHNWYVPILKELYPDGKVGQDPVCVLGLNKNKGQEILLRIRTDDLQGFRKILTIRKVLYHELAHNVHSDHDTKFFQLMRQIEKESIELDWTNGSGLTSSTMMQLDDDDNKFIGGTYRLGSVEQEEQKQEKSNIDEGGESMIQRNNNNNNNNTLLPRERAANAAMSRLSSSTTKSTMETTLTKDRMRNDSKCSCSNEADLFLPSTTTITTVQQQNENSDSSSMDES